MKEMKEYEAEVRRRIGEKTDKIKRTRRTLGVILPLMLCLVIVTVAAVPAMRGRAGKTIKKSLNMSIVQPVEAADLMEGITPDENIGKTASITEESKTAAADFAVRLFKACEEEGKNTLVSPLSVMCALSMTANGAAGDTLAEMEQTLGMTRDELNTFFAAYLRQLPAEDGFKLQSANSVWFRDDDSFTADRDFLQTNADYYGADAYKVPFDEATVDEINKWVSEKTDGMIPELADSFSGETVMCLINALALDAEWAEPYYVDNIYSDVFVREDGTEQTVDFMKSDEIYYIEDGEAKGFIKPYKYFSGNYQNYAFVAILPGEGVGVSDYVASLDGEKLIKILQPVPLCGAKAVLPKFKTEYSTEMSDVLKGMGMTVPFDGARADFSLLDAYRNKGIAIGRVIHKTFLEVDELGTRAGAGTMVEMKRGVEPNVEDVVLNRPFVYMIVDLETNLPIFIGTLNDVSE